MEKIIIEMHNASYGDAFLIKCIDEESQTNIVIDMGFSSTYKDSMKSSFEKLNEEGHVIDLMVFTHIDRDHIYGGIKFLQENGSSDKPNIIEVNEIWHNAYRHLQFDQRSDDTVCESDREILNAIKFKGIPIHENKEQRKNKNISAIEGTALGALILKGEYNWNTLLKEKAICIENQIHKKDITINGKVRIKLLSPSLDDLIKLNDHWGKMLRRNKGFKGTITKDNLFDDAFECLLGQTFDKKLKKRYKLISHKQDWKDFLEDNDIEVEIPNKSSIAFILEFGEKRILFSGDADPIRIEKSIREMYGVKKEDKIIEEDKIIFDAIKVSHHGSVNNTTTKLLDIIDSTKFIISTNGDVFNHPDIETIAKIVCRDGVNPREIIFNYENIKQRFDDKLLKKKYKYILRDIQNTIQIIEV